MKTEQLVIKEVVHIDEKPLKDGILYVSRRFELAIHNCACGCKVETVTPLNLVDNVGGWDLTVDPDGPTLHPSIGNQKLPCKSHYWVKNGKIVWC